MVGGAGGHGGGYKGIERKGDWDWGDKGGLG